MIGQVSRRLDHASCVAARTQAPLAAGIGHQVVLTTGRAVNTREAMAQEPAFQVLAEGRLDEAWNRIDFGVVLAGQGKPGFQMLSQQAVEDGLLRVPGFVDAGTWSAARAGRTGGQDPPAGVSMAAGGSAGAACIQSRAKGEETCLITSRCSIVRGVATVTSEA
jgi:hypothetical protein